MEHNKNGVLAFCLFICRTSIFVIGMVYHLWGTV